MSTPNQSGQSRCSILSTPASSIIILSNLIVGSRVKDRFVEITILFFKIVSIDRLNGIGRVGSTPVGFPVLMQILAAEGPSI
jgi:hypothetical protein